MSEPYDGPDQHVERALYEVRKEMDSMSDTMHRKLEDAASLAWATNSSPDTWPAIVDAILRAMLEPSEEMIDSVLIRMNAKGVVCEDEEIRHYTNIWQAMINHIINEADNG